MRTDHKLTVFTLADGTAITTRSALEARWAVFFTELGLPWTYEPGRISGYLPDFSVERLGLIEIKPTIALLLTETVKRIAHAAVQNPDEKIYVFCGERVSFDTVALYHDRKIFAPDYQQMIKVIHGSLNAQNLTDTSYRVSICIQRSNSVKLDHFVSIGKVMELRTEEVLNLSPTVLKNSMSSSVHPKEVSPQKKKRN